MDPLRFLVIGYCLTVAIELPILWLGLSPGHSWRRRLFAGFWLTATTYPIVVLVLPVLFDSRAWFLLVAETFAPLAECGLFLAAFPAQADADQENRVDEAKEKYQFRSADDATMDRDPTRVSWRRDCATIVGANLASFGLGELLHHFEWFG